MERRPVADWCAPDDVARTAGIRSPAWQQSLRQGTLAIVAGRFNAGERLNADAAARSRAAPDSGGTQACTVQLALLRREQGRPAEAEIAARGLRSEPAASSAVMAAILVDLGRDSEAWAELNRWSQSVEDSFSDGDWLAEAALFAEVAAVLGDRSVTRSIYERLLPHEDRFVFDEAGAACHGSVSRQLGLLAHRLDEWEDARGHYEVALAAHAAAGAPVLLAHTRRQFAALLRVRGGAGDWDRAVELLAGAEDVYRRLGVEQLAGQCQAVLARADLTDATGAPGGRRAVNLFRREGEGAGAGNGWLLRYNGCEARVGDERGLADLAHLLARPAQSLHVADLLLDDTSAGVGTAATVGIAPPWRAGASARLRPPHVLDGRARAEHRRRLDELEVVVEARRADQEGDPVEMALAGAERDRVEALLARDGDGDSLELAREAVATRIRLGVDAVERAHPDLGRHLRRSVRTGTFCSYEPASRTTWDA